MLLGVYAFGAGVLLLRLAVGTFRAHRLASASAPVTVGFFKPRIILPESSSEWPRSRLEAVLAHERAHARRRDPLFQWLALFNRAVFWFHPLAWWIERNLGALAEAACDEAVLDQGHDPREYSLCLLEMARTVEGAGTRVSTIAMAMPGVYLPQRIKSIMAGVRVPRVSRARLVCAAIACAIPAALFAAGKLDRAPQLLPLWPLPARAVPQPPELIAQAAQAPAPASPAPAPAPAPAPKLEFEVATVRPAAPLTPGNLPPRSGPGTSDPERVNYRYRTMKTLLMTAYGMPVNQVIGPPWIDSPRDLFDITAKVPPGATQEQVNVMLQNLLAGRFNLVVHRETRELPFYELTVAKNGLKMKPYVEDPNGPKFEPGKITLDKNGGPMPPPGGLMITMSSGKRRIVASKQRVGGTPGLVATLQPQLGRPVVDKTGLDGYYDYTLEFSLEGASAAVPGQQQTSSDSDAPDLGTAVEEQLGLKLTAKKGPVEVLVVDSGNETPTEN